MYSNEKERQIEPKKIHSHIHWNRVQLLFLVTLRARYWLFLLLTHSLTRFLFLYVIVMSYHLLSWILVFTRISAISRNDSSFVCFIFFPSFAPIFRCCCCCCWYHYFFVIVIDRLSVSFPLFIAYSIETT